VIDRNELFEVESVVVVARDRVDNDGEASTKSVVLELVMVSVSV